MIPKYLSNVSTIVIFIFVGSIIYLHLFHACLSASGIFQKVSYNAKV